MYQYKPYRVYRPAPAQPVPAASQSLMSAKSLMVLATLFTLTIVLVWAALAHSASVKAQALAEAAQREKNITILQQKLPSLLHDEPAVNFYISMSDELGSKSVNYNAYSGQDAASTGKLITAALFLNNVEKNKDSLKEKILGSDAKSELRAMINMSDDSAWAGFNDKMGHNNLQQYLASLDIYSYNADNNTISAADMTKFISLLYSGQLLNQAHTHLLLSYMQNTNYEDFISPAVKGKYAFYHKVGIDGDHVNDTAIISSKKNTLYITVYTDGQGNYNWPARANVMQRVVNEATSTYLN